MKIFGIGAFASLMMWGVTYPMDIIKTRMQANLTRPPFQFRYFHPQSKKGIWKEATKIYKKSGIKGFYRGLAPCLCRSIPVGGASILVYETLYENLYQ